MEKIDELAALIARQAPVDGAVDTAMGGLGLLRSSAATEPVHTLYDHPAVSSRQLVRRVLPEARKLTEQGHEEALSELEAGLA